MSARLASQAEVTAWRENGWVLLEGLISTEEIDAATTDLPGLFPTPEEYTRTPRA